MERAGEAGEADEAVGGGGSRFPVAVRFDLGLSQILTLLIVAFGAYKATSRDDQRVTDAEKAIQAQQTATREIREEIRQVNVEVRGELKEQGQVLRELRDKVNRARL